MEHVAVLKKYFGYDEYRPGQRDLIENILAGNDVLGIMPTGAGKSMCYQVPAMLMNGLTLVISPLISLMKDQVSALNQSGIKAAYINSSLSPVQQQEAMRRAADGAYKIIYIAPERLTSPQFVSFAHGVNISMLTVDEAHCISQWGQDFRPDYLNISGFVKGLEKRPVISAFTATATQQVKEDILKLLQLQNPHEQATGFDRANLHFAVQTPVNKKAFVEEYVAARKEQSGIIYCATRKAVEDVCDMLCSSGIAATRYHAGLDDAERHRNQDDFLFDKQRVMVATNAFGMGIDKSNVSFVLHYNMPKNIESYYQEAGRAGRDGQPADCTLLYSKGDVRTNKFLISNNSDNKDEKSIERELELLKQMTYYCTITECLREFMLRYFGEKSPAYCGNCSNCSTNYEEVDITIDAQKIISCVIRLERRDTPYGTGIVADVLKGSKRERLLRLRLDSLSTYGIMQEYSQRRIADTIDFLVKEGWLRQTDDEYPVLHSTAKSMEMLKGGQSLAMKLPKQSREDKTGKKGKDAFASDNKLFGILRKLRADIAREQGVPAFVVFADATLRDMCEKQPVDDAQFGQVSGVGKAKLEKYGERFTAAIREYLSGKQDDEPKKPAFTIPESTISKGFQGQYMPWTPEEDERLKTEYIGGTKLIEIGKLHKRSPVAVRARLVKLGLIVGD